MALGDWLGIVVIYGALGFAALFGLGTPLLFCYLRLGWTGFIAFMAGGGLCAGVTAYALSGQQKGLSEAALFTISGVISGLFFRIILFGFGQHSFAISNVSLERAPAKHARAKRFAATTFGILLSTAFLVFLYSNSDEHRSVTEQMGWQCVSVQDTKQPKLPPVESITMWFLKNPRYEERASGPHLCADLKAAGQSSVAVTFDVWGNRIKGLHGYTGVRISAGSEPLKIYGIESGGFHDDAAYGGGYNSSQHLGAHHFPLEVFK